MKHARNSAKSLAAVAYSRIVDKGPGLLWAFCRRFMWDEVTKFLQKEKCIPEGITKEQYVSKILDNLRKRAINSSGNMAMFYLFGKSKSLVQQEWLWRPISAAPKPFVCPRTVRLASCAMTCFIRTLLDKLPAPILRLSIGELGNWIHNLPWARLIGEADCKEQFNKIHSASFSTWRRVYGPLNRDGGGLTTLFGRSTGNALSWIWRAKPLLSPLNISHILYSPPLSSGTCWCRTLPSLWDRFGRALGAFQWGAVSQPKLLIYLAFGVRKSWSGSYVYCYYY